MSVSSYDCRFPQVVEGVVVRCGSCRGCLVFNKDCWTARAVCEAALHERNSFLTLTYADDPGELDYSHVQEFNKRLRHSGSFRFYCVGEYGERRGRGHWHMLVFGRSFGATGYRSLDSWPFGSVYIGDVTPASAGYCMQYSLKNTTDDRPVIREMSRRPGIGAVAGFNSGKIAFERGLDIPRGVTVYGDKGKRFLPFGAFMMQRVVAGYVAAGGAAPPEYSGQLSIVRDLCLAMDRTLLDRMVHSARLEKYLMEVSNGETPQSFAPFPTQKVFDRPRPGAVWGPCSWWAPPS